MKLDQIKSLGKELSKSELKLTFGGERGTNIAHGACNNGTTFSYSYVPGNSGDIDAFVNQHYCQGGGIAWIVDRGFLEP